MKSKHLFIFLGILLVFPMTTEAKCSYERRAELSKIASNVRFSYSYETGYQGNPAFTVNITNLTNDIYIKDSMGGIIAGDGETAKNYSSGAQITFDIYSKDPSCNNEKILTQYINLPVFNTYSKSDKCKENPDFKYCVTWGNLGIVDFEFDRDLETYKQSLNIKQITTDNDNTIVSFLKKYYLIIAIALLTILTLFIVRIIQRHRR